MFLNKNPSESERERERTAHKVTTFTSQRLTTRVKNTQARTHIYTTLSAEKEKLSAAAAERNKINVCGGRTLLLRKHHTRV